MRHYGYDRPLDDPPPFDLFDAIAFESGGIDCEECRCRAAMAIGVKGHAKLRISLDDPETRAIWETAKRAKAEVESWPAWKRGGGVP